MDGDDAAKKKFVKKLIRLTNADKIRWRADIADPNDHIANYKQWQFSTEWFQDEKPQLWINMFTLSGSYYGIQKLIQAIGRQYRRLELYKYSKDAKRRQATNRAVAKRVEAMEHEKLHNAIGEFLKAGD